MRSPNGIFYDLQGVALGWGAPRARDGATGAAVPHVDRLDLFPSSAVHGALSRVGQVLTRTDNETGAEEQVTLDEQTADDPHQKTTVTWNG